jgi:hypothetical protein
MKDFDSINNRADGIKPPRIIISNNPLRAKQVSLLSRPAPSRAKRILKLTLGLILAAIVVLGIFVFARATQLSNKIFVGQKTTFFQKIKDV